MAKKTCPCCNKKFVYNKKIRAWDVKIGNIEEEMRNYCTPCIVDINQINYEQSYEYNCCTPESY